MIKRTCLLSWSKLLEINIGRGCVLMLYDTELMSALPEDVLTMGLRRGKAIQRRRTFRERERKRAKHGSRTNRAIRQT